MIRTLLVGTILLAAAATAAAEPVAERLHFDTDRARVRTAAKATRARAAPELATAEKSVIIGHADGRGTELYNQWLALERAVRVRDVIVAMGIEPARVEVISEGEREPHLACAP